MATRPFAAIFVVVSAAVTIVVATTGCAWLLFGPCGMYGCPYMQVESLPPRGNPLALALSRPTDQKGVEGMLNAVVNAQSGSPAGTPCTEAAVAGCRYSIPVRMHRVSPPATTESVGCSLLDVSVEAGPRIRNLSYRPAPCPGKEPS